MTILEIVDASGNMDDETESYGGRPEQRITLKDKYEWFIGEECKELINHTVRKGL